MYHLYLTDIKQIKTFFYKPQRIIKIFISPVQVGIRFISEAYFFKGGAFHNKKSPADMIDFSSHAEFQILIRLRRMLGIMHEPAQRARKNKGIGYGQPHWDTRELEKKRKKSRVYGPVRVE